MKLEKIAHISGRIRVLSGLHIGAGKDTIEIGGLDQPIIKHPLSQEPYIPGSSVKGKMRSLLEVYYFINNGRTRGYVSDGKPCGCGQRDCPACVIFGPGPSCDKKTAESGPTRLIVRDSILCEEDRLRFERGELPMEVKYENIIHRVKGVAEHPRPLERVPAGVSFDFNLSFKVFEGDDKSLLDYVYKGLRLIELDALGGCGSRGCGQVRFDNLKCDEQDVSLENVSLDSE
jgi:CRISPR-associated protein Csm3